MTSCFYGMTEKQVDKCSEYARKKEREGLIAPLKHLQTTPVVMFNGKDDDVVWKAEMQATKKQLKKFIDHEYLIENFETKAGHVWSLDHGACTCGECTEGSYASYSSYGGGSYSSYSSYGGSSYSSYSSYSPC